MLACRDADDSGVLDLTDAIYTLNHLFLSGPARTCAARIPRPMTT